MTCPLGDGELTHHITQGESGLTIAYATCPTCHGYWMDSFAANYIRPEHLPTTTAPIAHAYHCPICTKTLVRSIGDNIPDEIIVFDCPFHHGYFFPTGQLAAFRKAQKTKIEYHKLWHIAMPNVTSILLGGILLLVLSGGLLFSLRGVQQQQTLESQAQQILTNHAVYTAPDGILVAATTSTDASVTLTIPSFQKYSQRMQTSDNRLHRLTLPALPAGAYSYSFAIDVSGTIIQSELFTFTVKP